VELLLELDAETIGGLERILDSEIGKETKALVSCESNQLLNQGRVRALKDFQDHLHAEWVVLHKAQRSS
jgi:hypothetical protein